MKKKFNTLFCLLIILCSLNLNASPEDSKKKFSIGIGAGGNSILYNDLLVEFIPFIINHFYSPLLLKEATIIKPDNGKSINLFFSYILSDHFRLKSEIDFSTISANLINYLHVINPMRKEHYTNRYASYDSSEKRHFAQWSFLLSYYIGTPNSLKFFAGIGLANHFENDELETRIIPSIPDLKYTSYNVVPLFELGVEYPISKHLFISASINYVSSQQYALDEYIGKSMLSYFCCFTEPFYKLGLHWKL